MSGNFEILGRKFFQRHFRQTMGSGFPLYGSLPQVLAAKSGIEGVEGYPQAGGDLFLG